MPQLDKVTFLSQFFWFCIVFFTMYLLLVKVFLPALARIVKARHRFANPLSESVNPTDVLLAGAPITPQVVIDAGVQKSVSAFQKRADFLKNWSSTELNKILPSLSPKFQKTKINVEQNTLKKCFAS